MTVSSSPPTHVLIYPHGHTAAQSPVFHPKMAAPMATYGLVQFSWILVVFVAVSVCSKDSTLWLLLKSSYIVAWQAGLFVFCQLVSAWQ